MEIPEELANLEANSGIYAVWMLFQHLGLDPDIEQLKEVCHYVEGDGTTTIGLAVGLKKFGLNVEFTTDADEDLQDQEKRSYAEAETINLKMSASIRYQDIQNAFNANKFVIVYYDTLEGLGNHSLVYDINDEEISFFDSFDAMTQDIFEQQRAVDGICRQAIIVEVSHYS